jgi:DNA-binding SARP family transcriptional activator/tetratricopeptide (TPR) repeat protein
MTAADTFVDAGRQAIGGGALMQLRLACAHEIVLADGRVVGLPARDAALLAWLAIEGPTPRDRLVALLWPEASQAQARSALRQRLFRLRRSLGADPAIGVQKLQLVDSLRHDLAGSRQVLGDLSFADAPDFDRWLARQRDARAEKYRDSLRIQVQTLEAAGDTAGALRVALDLLREEPLSELAHQRVIRLHYLGGDRAAALSAFDACERLLKDELGVRPSANTLALLSTVERAGAGSAPVAQRTLPMAVLRPPQTIGRNSEQRLLAQAWEAAQVATIVGEAGMGKSRLLKEFGESRAGVATASARPGDSDVPFGTLARLLRAIGDAGAGLPTDVAMRAQFARLLPELGDTAAMSPPGNGARLQQALVDYLQREANLQGIVVDDLHFADPASLEMLLALMCEEQLATLRWVVAFRPSEAGSALRILQTALAEAARSTLIVVTPLNESALAQLIDTLDLSVGSAAMAAQLWRQTGGNPLFVLETLKQAWLEGRTDVLPHAGLPRPGSVDRLLDQRIDRLSAGATPLAQLAAIAGVAFSIEMAESVLGTSALSLSAAWRELESAQVLKGTQFVHDLVFDAVLRSVPTAIAAHTHRQVAAWLEAQDGEPAHIARHWIAGDMPARAPHWLGLAAHRAAKALRLGEQIGFLVRKSELEVATGSRAAAFESQLEANRIGLVFDLDATLALARCDRLDELAATPTQALQATIQRADLAMLRRTDELAESLASRGLAEALRLGEHAQAMTCRIFLVILLLRTHRLSEALAQGKACIDWVQAHAAPVRQAELHTYLGLLYGDLGQQDEAMGHHQRAVTLAHEAAEPHHVTTALTNMARTLGESGELEEYTALISRALRLVFLHDPLPANTSFILTHQGHALVRIGHYTQALATIEQAEKLASRHYVDGKVRLDHVRLACFQQLGQWARVRQLTSDPRLTGSHFPALRVHLALAARSMPNQRGTEGDAALMATLAWLPPDCGVIYRDTLLLELARSQPALQSAAQLEFIRARCVAHGFTGHVLATRLYAAEALTGSDPELARQHALAALALAETHCYPYAYRAELWLICGKALLAAGDDEPARRILAHGRHWVIERARADVPDEFRDSFLHRNPVNSELLALAVRLGIDAP